MDKLWEYIPTLLTFAGIVVTAVWGPKAVAKHQGKQKAEEVKMEGDSAAEKLYVENMPVLLSAWKEQVSEYKDQVKGYKEQMERANEKITSIERDFSDFKKQHHKEVQEYQNQIDFLEERVEELEVENGHLKELLEHTQKGDKK